MSTCLPSYLSTCFTIFLPDHLPVCLFNCLPVFLSTYLPVYLTICLFLSLRPTVFSTWRTAYRTLSLESWNVCKHCLLFISIWLTRGNLEGGRGGALSPGVRESRLGDFLCYFWPHNVFPPLSLPPLSLSSSLSLFLRLVLDDLMLNHIFFVLISDFLPIVQRRLIRLSCPFLGVFAKFFAY